MYKLFCLILFFIGFNSFAQKQFYSVNGKKPINETDYIKLKDVYSKNGKIEEFILKIKKNKDSLINYIKLENLSTTPDGVDPWKETKKNIGKKFAIEKYIAPNSKNFPKNYLVGKPTVINFWFTSCPPCIEEIPILNKLKEKYGKKVNFISITYNNKKTVEEFLKKNIFKFEHITDSKVQIDSLNISAYPTTLILDKAGIIRTLNGEITDFEIKEIETVLNILL